MGVFLKRCKRGHLMSRYRRYVTIKGKRTPRGCGKCYRLYAAVWTEKHQQEIREQSKNRYFKNHRRRLAQNKERQCIREHGITLRQRDKILQKQRNRCANPKCRRKISNRGGHLDHCHKTGRNRGILCRSCNIALGLLGDKLQMLLGLIQYLKKYERGVRKGELRSRV